MTLFFIKKCGVFAIVIMVASCSMLRGVNSRQFTFYKNEKLKKLLFKLPKGKSEEGFRVGENDAKEQFYYISDGSVFYIAHRITWQTVNTHRIKMLDPKEQQGNTFSGKDNNGLYWKEIQFDDFRIGYAYVTGERLDRFDNALNSVKIR